MKKLEHWLDEASEADEFERSVLRSGLAVEPPPGAEDTVLSGVLGALAIAPVSAAVSAVDAAGAKTTVAGASKVTAVWLGVGKGFVVSLALYGAAVGTSEVVGPLSAPVPHSTAKARSPQPLPAAPVSKHVALNPQPEAGRSAPAAMPPASSPNRARSLAALRRAAPIATEMPSVAAFPAPLNDARPSQLQAEAAALRAARTELRAGKLADAFATLEASRRQFSAPELDQEREALLIELLFRGGQVSTAKQRAAAFLERFPESPHAAAIRQLSGP